MQLEISTGISPTHHHLLTSQSMPKTVFLDLELPHAASESLLKALIFFPPKVCVRFSEDIQ